MFVVSDGLLESVHAFITAAEVATPSEVRHHPSAELAAAAVQPLLWHWLVKQNRLSTVIHQ